MVSGRRRHVDPAMQPQCLDELADLRCCVHRPELTSSIQARYENRETPPAGLPTWSAHFSIRRRRAHVRLDAERRRDRRCDVELDRRGFPRALRLHRDRCKPRRVKLADKRAVHRHCRARHADRADRANLGSRPRRHVHQGSVGHDDVQLQRRFGRARAPRPAITPTATSTVSGGSGHLNTSTLGAHAYTVTTTSKDGQTKTASISYTSQAANRGRSPCDSPTPDCSRSNMLSLTARACRRPQHSPAAPPRNGRSPCS
jgi:hypothetical protein